MHRVTNQRQVIFNYLSATPLHPTAEQIFQAVRKNLPRISFGTVYRNLQVLESQGLIKILNYTKERARYDAAVDNHYHFVCEKCDKVEDLVCEELLDLNKQVESRHSLKIARHCLFFYGFCSDCEEYLQRQS